MMVRLAILNSIHYIFIIMFFLDSETTIPSSEEDESNSSSAQERKKNLRKIARKFYEEITDDEFFDSLEKEEPEPQISEAEAAKMAMNAEKELKTKRAGKRT